MEDTEQKSESFECNICFCSAGESGGGPVVTKCGHLYCWNCIYRWISTPKASSNACPVCKSGITKETCIPLYGRGSSSRDTSQHTDLPERPRGERVDPPPPHSHRHFAHESGVSFSFGFGILPQLFGANFHYVGSVGTGGDEHGNNSRLDHFVSFVMGSMGVLMVLILLFMPAD